MTICLNKRMATKGGVFSVLNLTQPSGNSSLICVYGRGFRAVKTHLHLQLRLHTLLYLHLQLNPHLQIHLHLHKHLLLHCKPVNLHPKLYLLLWIHHFCTKSAIKPSSFILFICLSHLISWSRFSMSYPHIFCFFTRSTGC